MMKRDMNQVKRVEGHSPMRSIYILQEQCFSFEYLTDTDIWNTNLLLLMQYHCFKAIQMIFILLQYTESEISLSYNSWNIYYLEKYFKRKF